MGRWTGIAPTLAMVTAGTYICAHLSLEASAPKEDETLAASPETVTLWFTQAPQMAGTSVRLVPEGGRPLELEPATARANDSTVVVLDVSETLTDGDYRVMWRAMAQDGHTIRGDFGFSVRSPDETPAAETRHGPVPPRRAGG